MNVTVRSGLDVDRSIYEQVMILINDKVMSLVKSMSDKWIDECLMSQRARGMLTRFFSAINDGMQCQ